jgi:pSer/pThr/pTyr-binding forkhead associated (FHA) protein
MMTEANSEAQKNTPKSESRASLLSSTMPIPVEDVLDHGSEMSLTIRNPNQTAPRHIPLSRETYCIGRHEKADIHIPGPSASREHARLFFLHDEEIVEDLNSTNGTFVNGVRVTRCVLQDKDIIRVGDTTMLFSRSSGNHTTGK